MMHVQFDEALARCLDRVVDGDSPTNRAARFPAFLDLLPLIDLAGGLTNRPPPVPSDAWLAESRIRVMDRVRLGQGSERRTVE